MDYPLTGESWTDPINQNLYASLIFWMLQIVVALIWRALKRRVGPNKFLSGMGWLILVLPPLAILGVCIWQGGAPRGVLILLVLSLLPATVRSVQASNKLKTLRAVGVCGAIQEPDVVAYRKFLTQANGGFSFLGVGAEKLTRDFEAFQAMVARCGTPSKPVRLLLVSPVAPWLQIGASRRGLNKTTFQAKHTDSLKKIERIKSQFSGEIEVRFYQDRPSLRLMFANGDVCWLGHYTETAATPGKNEYEQKSNPCVVLKRPSDRAPDQQLYGALEGLFDEMWTVAEKGKWDFKTYLQ
ncbi:hypothetical protein [Alcaligenes aquatilis]|uniref:hypothetical protein n=1 Tax=Alcaligenes aquatilis TaxID=323284 RepID=UPI00360754DD